RQLDADRALGGEWDDLARSEASRREHLEHDPPDRPGRPDDRHPRMGAHRASPNGFSATIVPSPARPNAACSPRTASGTLSPAITHEILIGEVEIISML